MQKDKGEHAAESGGSACEVYASQVLLFWTGRDVRLLFRQVIVTQAEPNVNEGRLGEWSNQETKLVAEDRAGVTMTWFDVKTLAVMLAEAVGRYEKVNGDIKQPICPEGPAPEVTPQRFN